MPEATFGVVYDGPALADGSMRVADLAPALLALGDLFVAASRIAYPEQDPVGLNFRATEKGSFLVELALHSPDTWEQIRHFFSGETVTALLNIKELVIGGPIGLFCLIKKLRGQKVEKTEIRSGIVKVTLLDGTTIEMPAEVWTLYNDAEARRTARKVVEPLTKDGLETLDFRSTPRPPSH